MFGLSQPQKQSGDALSSSCPHCGGALSNHSVQSLEAPARITDLESQVKILSGKAAAAADKLADYEDEIRRLRISRREVESKAFATPPPDTQAQVQAQVPFPAQAGRLTTLASLFPGRKGSPSTPPTPGLPPSQISHTASGSTAAADSADLPAQLIREKALREKAESSLKAAHSELEELTAQLFGQANEMVAAERKARARLEERVELLEKRDVEKRRRLERLEGAVRRVERVRGLISGNGGS